MLANSFLQNGILFYLFIIIFSFVVKLFECYLDVVGLSFAWGTGMMEWRIDIVS